MSLFAIMVQHKGLRFFLKRIESRPNCVYQRSNYLLFYPLHFLLNQTKTEVQWYTCGASGELVPITKTLTEKLQGQ